MAVEQIGVDCHDIVDSVQIRDHVPEELAHLIWRVVSIAEILHLALESKIERFLGRFIETNATEYIPMTALVKAILLVAGKKEVVQGQRIWQLIARYLFHPHKWNANSLVEQSYRLLLVATLDAERLAKQ